MSLYRPLPSLFWYRDTLALIDEIVDQYVFEKLSSEGDSLPVLATSWERSEDGRALTVHLRRTATWSDGRPMTSRDVVATFDAVGRLPTSVGHLFEDYASVETLDDHTVVVRAVEPIGSEQGWRRFLEMTVLPAHIVADLDGEALLDPSRNPLITAPIGTGPYRVESFETLGRLVLVRRADADRPALLDRVELVPLEARDAVRAVQEGRLDVADGVGADIVAEVTAQAGSEAICIPQNRRVQITFRAAHPALSTALARRAIVGLIHREDLWPDNLRSIRVPTECFSLRGSPTCTIDSLVAQDEPLAALDAAGVRDTDGDGVREVGGEPVRLRLVAAPIGHAVAETIATRLRAGGLPVEVTAASSAEYPVLEAQAGHDLFLGASQHSSEWGGLDELIGTTGAYNRAGFGDEGIDALIDALRTTVGEQERLEAFARLAVAAVEARALVVLWQEPRCVVASTRVHGIDRAMPIPRFAEWSIAR